MKRNTVHHFDVYEYKLSEVITSRDWRIVWMSEVRWHIVDTRCEPALHQCTRSQLAGKLAKQISEIYGNIWSSSSKEFGKTGLLSQKCCCQAVDSLHCVFLVGVATEVSQHFPRLSAMSKSKGKYMRACIRIPMK